jgi:hypothetical protein
MNLEIISGMNLGKKFWGESEENIYGSMNLEKISGVNLEAMFWSV